MSTKFIIFGCGEVGIKTKQLLEQQGNEIIAFTDNDAEKWGKICAGIKIISPTEIKEQPFDVVAIGIYKAAETIQKQLTAMGIDENRIVVPLKPQRIYVNPEACSQKELTCISELDKTSESTKRYENYHILVEDKSFMNKLESLKTVLEDNNIPRNKVCVVSGAVLQAYGLTKSKLFDDIDIIMTSDLRQLYGNGLVIVSEYVEMHPKDEHTISDDEIINNAQNHFIFSDLKFLDIEIYYEYLKKRGDSRYLLLEKFRQNHNFGGKNIKGNHEWKSN